jgi:hypothetical protein
MPPPNVEGGKHLGLLQRQFSVIKKTLVTASHRCHEKTDPQFRKTVTQENFAPMGDIVDQDRLRQSSELLKTIRAELEKLPREERQTQSLPASTRPTDMDDIDYRFYKLMRLGSGEPQVVEPILEPVPNPVEQHTPGNSAYRYGISYQEYLEGYRAALKAASHYEEELQQAIRNDPSLLNCNPIFWNHNPGYDAQGKVCDMFRHTLYALR